MGLRLKHLSRDALRRGARFYLIIALAWVAFAVPIAWAADALTTEQDQNAGNDTQYAQAGGHR